jgi:hypothetical protein
MVKAQSVLLNSVNEFGFKYLCLFFQALYNSVVEKTQAVEQVNVVGGRFIREAKVSLRHVIYQQRYLGKLVWMCCECVYGF